MTQLPDCWRCIDCDALLNDQTRLTCASCESDHIRGNDGDRLTRR